MSGFGNVGEWVGTVGTRTRVLIAVSVYSVLLQVVLGCVKGDVGASEKRGGSFGGKGARLKERRDGGIWWETNKIWDYEEEHISPEVKRARPSNPWLPLVAIMPSLLGYLNGIERTPDLFMLCVYTMISVKVVGRYIATLTEMGAWAEYVKGVRETSRAIRNVRKAYVARSRTLQRHGLPHQTPTFVMSKVSSAYEGRRWGCYNVDLVAECGKVVSVKGSGKSSLVRSVAGRVYGEGCTDVKKVGGAVRLFGVEVERWDEGCLRSCVGVVGDGRCEQSWMEGRGIVDGDIDGRVLKAASELVGSVEDVKRVGGGIVHEAGLSQSGVVRLVLTRKIYALMVGLHPTNARPRYFPNSLFGTVLLLDCVLDALPIGDAQTILDNLRKSGAITVVTTRRDDVEKLADRSVVLEDGEVATSVDR